MDNSLASSTALVIKLLVILRSRNHKKISYFQISQNESSRAHMAVHVKIIFCK